MPTRGSYFGAWARAAIGRPMPACIVKIPLHYQTSPTAGQLRALFTMASPVLAQMRGTDWL
jgi:hypothetical protein